MKTSFSVSTYLAAPPDVLCNAWLSSEEHSRFSRSPATIDPNVGGAFTAGGGYIRGATLEKEEGTRIVQSWRTTEFPDESPDSRLEVLFEPAGDGTKVTINHSAIPEGQAEDYESGWEEFYFQPMREYYGAG
jgi:activator of HSP90 ATPase